MKTARKLHLWLGTLFAPSIIFFALSGAFQVLGMHEGDGANAFAAKLAQVHKNQTIDEAPKKAPRPAAVAKPETPQPPREGPHRSMLLVVFFVAMALGLICSSGLGIYMAFAYKRDRRVIIGLLAAGTILPIVGLFV